MFLTIQFKIRGVLLYNKMAQLSMLHDIFVDYLIMSNASNKHSASY